MIKDTPLDSFLEELASKSPTPGGGSAAAIMGGLGAALVAMVCNLTIGKKNYESVSDDLTRVLAEAQALRVRLVDMVSADVEVFEQVMAAYGLPKDTEFEKQTRSAAIQTALKAATEVPLECARACAEIIRLSGAVAEQGNKNVLSDAGVAVVAAHAALRSVALNVYVNANAIQDRAFVTPRLEELERILEDAGSRSEGIYQQVRGRL